MPKQKQRKPLARKNVASERKKAAPGPKLSRSGVSIRAAAKLPWNTAGKAFAVRRCVALPFCASVSFAVGSWRGPEMAERQAATRLACLLLFASLMRFELGISPEQ
jgi:hypothetical protein